ncbi:copper oxidase, partial [Streptomyces sp. SID724]|nr:copper oxidase [Streptomyces sp. SID724]
QSHSDMGMAGLLLIKKADGTIPGYEPHHAAGGTEKKAGAKGAGANADKAAKGAAEHQH